MIPTPEQIQAARDDLARFERAPTDGSQREWRPVAADSLRVALAAMDDARDNADAAEDLAREADAERKTAEAALAALRIEHAAWGAVIDGLRASLADYRSQADAERARWRPIAERAERAERERDEARQYIPAAQSCHRLADYMSTNRDLLEYDGCDMAGDGAIDVLGRLARERDELRAALLTTIRTLRDPRLGVSEGVVDGIVAGIKEATGMDADTALAGGKS